MGAQISMDVGGQTVPTEQLWVHCGKCKREMALGWLPMPLDSAVKLLKNNKCACGSRKFFMNRAPKPTPVGDAHGWLLNADTGTSSETIWAVMMGRSPNSRFRPGIPHDPADFGRCYRLLQVMPEWVERMPDVAAKYTEWAVLVREWATLTAMYEQIVAKGDESWDVEAAKRMLDVMDALRSERQREAEKGDGAA